MLPGREKQASRQAGRWVGVQVGQREGREGESINSSLAAAGTHLGYKILAGLLQ